MLSAEPASIGSAERQPPWRVATAKMPDDGVRRALLALFAAALPLAIAVQQTMLAIVLMYFAVVAWRRRAWPRTPLDLPLATFAAALLLSTAFSPDAAHSLRAYDRLWIVGAFFATYHLLVAPREIERLLWISALVGGIVAVYGVVQHFTGVDLARQLMGKAPDIDRFATGAGYRTNGLHPSGITYAHNLLFPLTFATVYALAPGIPAARRTVAAVAWIAMVLALVFSATRGVWLAFIVVLVAIALVRGGKAAFAAAAALAVVAILLVGFDAGVTARTRSAFDLPANLGRTQIWRANVDMARERPLLGWGYGNYKHARQPFYDRYPNADTTAHAHNNFLQMLVDGGVLTLTAFTALFVVILRHGWRGYRALQADDEPARSVVFATMLAVVGFLVGGLTQYNFGDAEVVIYLWFTVALLMRAARFAVVRRLPA
jgi:O-antigen ligase